MNQAARRIGKSIALALPVVLVLTGTLAVTRVPWAPPGTDQQVLAAASGSGRGASSDAVRRPATPQEALRQRLLNEVQTDDPGAALTDLQRAMARKPSLAAHCASIARALGRAAVARYRGDVARAQRWSRPVCDTSFATGVAGGR